METRCHQTSSFVMNSSNKYRSRSWHYSRRKFCSSYCKLTLLVTLVKILVTQHDVTICHALFKDQHLIIFLGHVSIFVCIFLTCFVLAENSKFRENWLGRFENSYSTCLSSAFFSNFFHVFMFNFDSKQPSFVMTSWSKRICNGTIYTIYSMAFPL